MATPPTPTSTSDDEFGSASALRAPVAHRCPVIDPVWDRQCAKGGDHEGVHQNDEIPGDRITWGTVADMRAYERGEVI